MDAFQKILNQKVDKISLLCWSDHRYHLEIQEVLIHLHNEQFLVLKIGGDDTILIEELYEYELRVVVEGNEIVPIYSNSENQLSKMLDKSIENYWILKNDYGVINAFEMEVMGGIYKHTFRFLVQSNSFKIGKVQDIEV